MPARILCPVDLSHEASWQIALPEAVEETRLRRAELHLLAVVPDVGMAFIAHHFPPDYEKQMLENALAELRGLAKAQLPEGMTAECHIAHGHIAEQILKAADEIGASLIVLASHRPETLRTLFVSSVADKIAHNASQSVLIVRRPGG